MEQVGDPQVGHLLANLCTLHGGDPHILGKMIEASMSEPPLPLPLSLSVVYSKPACLHAQSPYTANCLPTDFNPLRKFNIFVWPITLMVSYHMVPQKNGS